MSLLADEFSSGDLSSANTAFIAVYSVGATIGPFLCGLSMDYSHNSGFVAFPATMMGLLFVALLVPHR
jgi:dipeptide/tripeptide permease